MVGRRSIWSPVFTNQTFTLCTGGVWGGVGEGGHEMKIKYSGRGIKIKMPLHTLLAWYMVNLTIISSKFEEMSPYC